MCIRDSIIIIIIISTIIKPIIIIYWFFNKTNNNYLLVFARAPCRAPAGALDPRGRRALVRQCGDAAVPNTAPIRMTCIAPGQARCNRVGATLQSSECTSPPCLLVDALASSAGAAPATAFNPEI